MRWGVIGLEGWEWRGKAWGGGGNASEVQPIRIWTCITIHVLVQLNDVVQESWINATLLWASESMGISDTTIYALNMTDGLPAGQDKSFQVPPLPPLSVSL